MFPVRIVPLLLLLVALVCTPHRLWAAIDSEQLIGTTGCTKAGNNSADWDTIAQCPSNGGTWVRAPYFFGSTGDSCDSNHGGLTYYSASAGALEYCDGTQWRVVGAVAATGSTASSFSFTALTGQAVGVLATSNTDTITGFTGTLTASVTGGGMPQISINGGPWTTSGAITSGQTIQVRMTTSPSANTALTATVTIGTTTATWSVTTTTTVKLIFMTASAYSIATIGSLTNADTLCNTAASTAGYAGTYKAILSDESTNAKDRLSLSYPIVRASDGKTVVARTNLFIGSISNSIGTSGASVWTGSDQNGNLITGYTCTSWTSTSGTAVGGWSLNTSGILSTKAASWIYNTNYGSYYACTASEHLYCVQQ